MHILESSHSVSTASVCRLSPHGSMTRNIDDDVLPSAEDLTEAENVQEDLNAKKTPLKPLLILSYVLFLCVHVTVLFQGLRMLLIKSAQPAHVPPLETLILLILVKLCTIATLSYLTFCNLVTRCLTQAQLADWNLIYLAVVIPVANLNFFFNLPTFDVTMQSWPLFVIFLMTLGVYVAELPPRHRILQYLMSAPVLMFLEYEKQVRIMQCQGLVELCCSSGKSDENSSSQPKGSCTASSWQPEGSCTASSSYSSTLSPITLVALSPGVLIVMVVPLMIILASVGYQIWIPLIRSNRPTLSFSDPESRNSNVNVDNLRTAASSSTLMPMTDEVLSELLPFETFGIYIVRRLGLAPLLLYIDTQLQALMNIIPHRWSVLLVCAPLGALYLLRILVGRVNKNSSISISHASNEEWLMVLMVFFLLGRESNKMDTDPLLHSFRSRLSASQAILSDMLPSHIVDQMLDHSSPPIPSYGQQHPRQGLASQTSGLLFTSNESPLSQSNLLPKGIWTQDFGRFSAMSMPEDPSSLETATADRTWCSNTAMQSPTLPPAMMDLTVTADDSSVKEVSRGRSLLVLNPDVVTKGYQTAVAAPGDSAGAPAVAAPARSGKARRSSLFSDQSLSFGGLSAAFKDYTSAGGPLLCLGPGSTLTSPRDVTRAGTTTDEVTSNVMARPLTSPAACAMLQHKNVSESHECVTVFFSDIVGFSSWAHTVPALNVMKTLDDLYTRLDNIIMQEIPSLYKVETIGDAYMVASNLVVRDVQHAATMVRFALRVQEEASKVPRPDVEDGSMLQMRIGIHSGPVVSGIVGKLRRRFCLFGDTVNMASRTETSCPSGSIQLTQACYDLAAPYLSEFEVAIESRGPVEVKGAALPVRMYLASAAEQFLL